MDAMHMQPEKYEPCPMCANGKLREYDDGEFTFRYGHRLYKVPNLLYGKCDQCGTEAYLEGNLSENQKRIGSFQKKLVKIISPTQIRELREKYDLSQKVAAQIFGGGVSGISKWERGEAIPGEATAKLMLLALRVDGVFTELARLSSVMPPMFSAVSRDRQT